MRSPQLKRCALAAFAVWMTICLLGGCQTNAAPSAQGVDVTLPDAAPDASTIMFAMPVVGVAQPALGPGFDDRAHIANPNVIRAFKADPHATQREFFLAWVRVSMPTAGPGARGTVSAVFSPQVDQQDEYWKTTEAKVLCPSGSPSIRGTNLSDIDCGS